MEEVQLILSSSNKDEIKRIEARLKTEKPSAEDAEILIKYALANHNSWIMAIDQSYDSTGFALIIPNIDKINKKAFKHFLFEVFPFYETRIIEDMEQVKEKFNQALKNNGGSLHFQPSDRKHSFPFGAVIGESLGAHYGGAKNSLILHGAIVNLPSDEPEWKLASNLANKLVSLAKEFQKLIPNEEKLNIYMEGLALAGNPKTVRNLPIFGGLYLEIFRQFCSDEIGNFFAEMPISTWKSTLFGTTRGIEKTHTQLYLTKMGLGPFQKSKDDDSDALAISLVGLLECHSGLIFSKLTRGRIRPTSDQRVVSMQKRKEKKIRKEVREKKSQESKELKEIKAKEKMEKAALKLKKAESQPEATKKKIKGKKKNKK